jgi:hypothetical protein
MCAAEDEPDCTGIVARAGLAAKSTLTVLLAAQAPSFRAGIAVEFVSFCRIL